MTIQDDYYELNATLKGPQKQALNRIWDAFLQIDKENEQLKPIINHLKQAITLLFQEEK